MTTRDDLVELIDRSFAALPTGDLGALPLSPGVRMTENGEDVGPGAWAPITAVTGPLQHPVADPELGQVVSWALVEEDGDPAILGVRLGVANGRIAEIETLACRPRRQAEGGLL